MHCGICKIGVLLKLVMATSDHIFSAGLQIFWIIYSKIDARFGCCYLPFSFCFRSKKFAEGKITLIFFVLQFTNGNVNSSEVGTLSSFRPRFSDLKIFFGPQWLNSNNWLSSSKRSDTRSQKAMQQNMESYIECNYLFMILFNEI